MKVFLCFGSPQIFWMIFQYLWVFMRVPWCLFGQIFLHFLPRSLRKPLTLIYWWYFRKMILVIAVALLIWVGIHQIALSNAPFYSRRRLLNSNKLLSVSLPVKALPFPIHMKFFHFGLDLSNYPPILSALLPEILNFLFELIQQHTDIDSFILFHEHNFLL